MPSVVPEPRDVSVPVVLTKTHADLVKRRAKAAERSASSELRLALRGYLARIEREQAPTTPPAP